MANTDGMKCKYIVIKKEDVDAYLGPRGLIDLKAVLCTINRRRHSDNKKGNTYLVINTDEIYADEVIEIMKRNSHCG